VPESAFTAGTLRALMAPRPAVKITTHDEMGKEHTAPFAYVGVVAHDPPTISVSILRDDGKMKATARNALRTRRLIVDTDRGRMFCQLTRAIDVGDAVLLLARVERVE